jgi:hypothetical protein
MRGTAGSVANASLTGDTVDAHVFEQSVAYDFSTTSAVVAPGAEFVATFVGGIALSLDMHANGFTLTYQNTLASEYNVGLASIEITDLDFSPAASPTPPGPRRSRSRRRSPMAKSRARSRWPRSARSRSSGSARGPAACGSAPNGR